MRFLKRFFLILLLVALFVPTVNAKDPCLSPIIRSWENQREASAVRLVKLFLGNAGAQAIRKEGFELLRAEVLLSPCIPPLRPENFYLLNLEDSNPDLLPIVILRSYLRKHRIPMEAREFFIGKTFWLESK